MRVFRLSKTKYADHLSGEGSRLSGGRWNSKGTRLVYTSASRALAAFELYVHLNHSLIPDGLVMVEIDIPDSIDIPVVDVHDLPHYWNELSNPTDVQSIGDHFIAENQYLALGVPSAVIQGDFNYLINPQHKDFKMVSVCRVDKFPYDTRLFYE